MMERIVEKIGEESNGQQIMEEHLHNQLILNPFCEKCVERVQS